MPKYFGYEKIIENKLNELGFSVTLIYENIDEINILYRMMLRYFPNDKDKILYNYYIKKINQLQFDKVFVIRGSTLCQAVIDKIKLASPKAKFYMYQWDSVKNNKNAIGIAHNFEKILTFDIVDSDKYNWIYRPLFFIKQSNRSGQRLYDLAYICSLHSQRLKLYNDLKAHFNKKKIFFYMYSN